MKTKNCRSVMDKRPKINVEHTQEKSIQLLNDILIRVTLITIHRKIDTCLSLCELIP